MSNVEFWFARPTHYWQIDSNIDGSFAFARIYEDVGFDGMLFFDTQNLSPEVYVSLTAAAKETTTLGLGTGVTNPMTRHAAVSAATMSTLQEVSNGRAYLGIAEEIHPLPTWDMRRSRLANSRSIWPVSRLI